MTAVHSDITLRKPASGYDWLDSRLAPSARDFGAPQPRQPLRQAKGTVALNERGFGFVSCAQGLGYFLPSKFTRGLMSGDLVSLEYLEAENGRPEVHAVLEVERAPSRVLGTLESFAPNEWGVISDDPCGCQLRFSGDRADLAPGLAVAVRVPGHRGQVTRLNTRVVVELEHVLGSRSAVGFDLAYTRWRHGFESDMPSSLVESAQAAVGDFAGLQDLTALPFVTIDGESTQDMDDALFAEPLMESGRIVGYSVKVAIADVSFYVSEGSELDAWAKERATAVYLPGQMLPMLPAALSSELCSLRPGEDRRAVVLHLGLNLAGEVTSRSVSRCVIRSAGKLVYREVADHLAGGAQRYGGSVEQSLLTLASVAELLRALRTARGLLDFDEPEPSFKSVDGAWVLTWETRTAAHKLVEEFMLLANEQVAHELMAKQGAALLRHQPAPLVGLWDDFCAWSTSLGAGGLSGPPSIKALADWLKSLPAGQVYNAASMKARSMMRPATYLWHADKARPCGHFSLGFEWYTHFSSPIRRYADLVVHRLLLQDEPLTDEQRDTLFKVSSNCSGRALAAKLAERRIVDGLKLCAFDKAMTVHDVLPARVLRANPKGLRVLLGGWQCAASISAQDLQDLKAVYSPEGWVLEGVVLSDGVALEVTKLAIDRTRPAYPNLCVRLSAKPLAVTAAQ